MSKNIVDVKIGISVNNIDHHTRLEQKLSSAWQISDNQSTSFTLMPLEDTFFLTCYPV